MNHGGISAETIAAVAAATGTDERAVRRAILGLSADPGIIAALARRGVDREFLDRLHAAPRPQFTDGGPRVRGTVTR